MTDPARRWVDRDRVMAVLREEADAARSAAIAGRPEALPVVLARIWRRLEALRVATELSAPMQVREMGPREL